jgi:hypothetical protein
MMALVNTGPTKAGDCTETNAMPAPIHNLMDSHGYAFDQNIFSLPRINTDSLRSLPFIARQRMISFSSPASKTGWNPWDNLSLKYVGRSTDQINVLAPFKALSLYEYDISYSFDF